MPGSITHLIVQRRLPGYLAQLPPALQPQGSQYAQLLLNDPNSPYTGFGSMGPDFLFFSTADYGPNLEGLIHFLFKVFDVLEPIITSYNQNVEIPIQNLMTQIGQAVFPANLISTMQQIQTTVASTQILVNEALEAGAVSVADLFYLVKPRIQEGDSENTWFWSDYLHYRRTGLFCSNMWRLAGDDSDLKRYCLGYAGHIGTDVVGH